MSGNKRILTGILLLILLLPALPSCSKEKGAEGGGSDSGIPKDYSISGVVKGDDGALLKDVVVSDGLHCTKTNEKGCYYLPADLTTAEYVFVSTPSGYAAPVQEGCATFWKFLKDCTKGANGKYVIDFTLSRIPSPDRYSVLIFADPQPRKATAGLDKVAYHSLDCCEDMYRDMKEYVASQGSGRAFYGIGLGDIVHQDLSLLPQYRNGMSTTGVSTYSVIGNHDHGHRFMEDAYASKDYEAIMGPANYSFNLGGMHYLVLDNMISGDPNAGKYSDECTTGLTDAIWEWVKADLALVPLTTPLMVCAHSPMMRLESGKDRSGLHLGDLRNLISKYEKAYVWAGHTHTTFNYVDKDNPVIETHTVTRATGALWTNEYLGANGTPRGYIIFDYDNGNVSWKFKPTFYQTSTYTGNGNQGREPDYTWRDWDYVGGKAVMKADGKPLGEDYQMQLFPPGTYGDSYLYANVFLWDELWQTPRFTQDGVPSLMKRVTETDYRYSYSDWSITSFYHQNTSIGSEFVPDRNNVSSMFRVYVETEHGSGTVSVKDRFGNTHTSSITW